MYMQTLLSKRSNPIVANTYTFIHPTKTGGTACEKYFKEHYSQYITSNCHDNLCTNTNRPIIIVRDVLDRFVSMYKYWKYGANDTEYKRPAWFLYKYRNYSIHDFIVLLQKKKVKDLHQAFTYFVHFKPVMHWINRADYKNIIVILYDGDLNTKIHSLLHRLEIPDKNIVLPRLNTSNSGNTSILLSPSDIQFIREYFKEDCELVDTIKKNPELFKMVI